MKRTFYTMNINHTIKMIGNKHLNRVFLLATENWTLGAALQIGRHGTQAICYKNAIYIVAGSGNQGGKPELASLEVFSE